ncbi:MAG: regulatory protein RecX [Fimbriimonadaceae bacterium]|nr:regulatory protein RecX [Fimbriimonadaceae bacterium]
MSPDEAFSHALAAAVHLLSRKDRFERTIRDRLTAEGYDSETVARVLDHLRRRGLVSDERAVENSLRHPTGKYPVGADRLRSRLIEAGAPEDLVRERMAQLDTNAETELLEQAVRRRYPLATDRAKAARWSAGRGFEEETIRAALNRVYGDSEGEA